MTPFDHVARSVLMPFPSNRKKCVMNTKLKASLLAGLLAFTPALSSQMANAQDDRQMVKLPAMMQYHMLGNMRDHLRALEEILSELADGNANKAAEIAEKRLGMSSLNLHGAAHMGKFMPAQMRQYGTQMHKAASQFAITVKNAELEPGDKSNRKVYGALQQITQNCNACHQSYKIR